MRTFVALLRGINVGGRNRVGMAALRDALAADGYRAVRTYLQSGNVVLDGDDPQRVAADVRAAVARTAGIDVPVVLRAPAELRGVLDWDPFPDRAAAEPKLLHVLFCDREPDPAGVAELLAGDFAPDALAHRGRELALSYTDGMARSKLQYATVLRRCGVDGTARNWRTVRALAELAELAG